MQETRDPLDELMLRANDGAARPIFALATLAYGVVVLVSGVGLWEGQNAPTLLSSAALIVGTAMMAAAVLGLLVQRWRVVASAVALPAAASAALGVIGLVGVLAIPGVAGLDPDRMAWAMTLGMFAIMWAGTVGLAHAVDDSATAGVVRSHRAPGSSDVLEHASPADLAA